MKRFKVMTFVSFLLPWLLIYHSIRDFSKYSNYFNLMKSEEILERAILDLKKRNQEITEEIEKIKNSKPYALKVLRERYHLTEENEKIIFFSE